MTELRPKSIEQGIIDLKRALTEPDVHVVPTNELFLEMLVLIAQLAGIRQGP